MVHRTAGQDGRTPGFFYMVFSSLFLCILTAPLTNTWPGSLFVELFKVNWSALWMNYKSRALRQLFILPLLALVVMIPMPVFSAALMQLSSLICPSHQCTDPATREVTTTSRSCPNSTFIRSGKIKML